MRIWVFVREDLKNTWIINEKKRVLTSTSWKTRGEKLEFPFLWFDLRELSRKKTMLTQVGKCGWVKQTIRESTNRTFLVVGCRHFRQMHWKDNELWMNNTPLGSPQWGETLNSHGQGGKLKMLGHPKGRQCTVVWIPLGVEERVKIQSNRDEICFIVVFWKKVS